MWPLVGALGGALVVVSGLLASPSSAVAQRTSLVGVVGGYASTEQIWKPEADVESVGGLVIGAYVDARTPLGWLSVLAEGSYTQRGGDVVGAARGGAQGAVRSDYLSVAVRPGVGVRVGPARLRLSAGPAFDLLVRSRLASGFETVLDREASTVFGLLAGVGLDLSIGGGRTVGLEGRLYEGLADAYSGDFVSLRNRSREVVARFGITLDR